MEAGSRVSEGKTAGIGEVMGGSCALVAAALSDVN
jgi:hypothetical protein